MAYPLAPCALYWFEGLIAEQPSFGEAMNFNLNTQEDSTVLSIGGELDALSVRDLRPVINRIGEDQPSKVLVDLSRLRLIDSSGVGAIVALFKKVKAYEGSLAVVGAQDQPLAILRLLQLDRVLTRASS
jgi:anti-sigma B factor antagonist